MLGAILMCEGRTCCICTGTYGVGAGWLFVFDGHLSPSNSLGDLWMM